MFLTAAKEYKALSVCSIAAASSESLPSLFDIALDSSVSLVELSVFDKHLGSLKGVRHAVSIPEEPVLTIDRDDVIVMTGGGRGVTSFVARALAANGCRLILLGRSELLTSVPESIPEDPEKDVSFVEGYLRDNGMGLSPQERSAKRTAILNNIEIQRTLADLKRLGARAEYFSCDVTNQASVESIIDEVYAAHGRIDGVIHGAGILRDSFIPLIKKEMLEEVMQIKLFGASNLLTAVEGKGVRFVATFSSIASAGGNVGQANYCMANRAMAEYCRMYAKTHEDVVTKVFWLPPIEGAGMAENPELKDILKLNMGQDIFLEVKEASELMVRELLNGPPQDCWIAPLRDLPSSDTVLMDEVVDDQHWFSIEELGMIDSLREVDISGKALHACRTINSSRDIWLADHRPSKGMAHPVLSAIMAIEAFF